MTGVFAADDPGRFRLLAMSLSGRPLGVVAAAPGELPYTDGSRVYVTAGAPPAVQRREVLVQSALLGGGSLEPDRVRALRGRQKVARRYLALEGRRVLAGLAGRVALATVDSGGPAVTDSAEESLRLASGRAAVTEPPAWFGQIRAGRLIGRPRAGAGAPPTGRDLRLDFKGDRASDDDGGEDDSEAAEDGKLLKLLANPLTGSTMVTNFLSKMLGLSRSSSTSTAGGGGVERINAIRRMNEIGPHARPLPVPLSFASTEGTGPAGGFGGALYPEWDVHKGRYRPEWCRVVEVPLPPVADVVAAGVERDEALRRRLARLGLGPQIQRRRPDGDDVDVDALIDLAVNLRAGHSPAETIYLERRKLARNLGILILVDASGSATETDPDGRSVHEHQRRAAATLAVTLEELGDRVAVYGFRSRGRATVQLLALKPFSLRFGAGGRAQLNSLEPAGYTRLGAAVRHAGEILKTQAGTPNRLLVVLSDGFPYDDGYESRYAEADARRALEELRSDGVACLCLSIGTSTGTDALDRVFGSASHASAARLGDLSSRMDELFLAALKELSAPNPQARRTAVTAGSVRPAGRRPSPP